MRLGGMKWHDIVVFFGPTSMLQMVISTVFRGRKRMKTGCFRVDVGGLRLEADASMVQRALQKLGYMDGGLNTDLMEAMLVLLGPFQRLFLTYLKRWHLKIHCRKVVLVDFSTFFLRFINISNNKGTLLRMGLLRESYGAAEARNMLHRAMMQSSWGIWDARMHGSSLIRAAIEAYRASESQ